MAQITLERWEGLTPSQVFKSGDLENGDMRVGLMFISEDVRVQAILDWGAKVFCPLVKARRDKTLSQTNGTRRERRYFECSHGRPRRIGTTKGERPKHNVNLTKVSDVY